MAAVRRKQAHRQPAPPDMRTLIHEAAIHGASRMEISTPTLDALASAWPQALRVGWSCFAWVGGAVGAGSYLLDHNPLMAAANLFVTGGPAAFLVTIVWSVAQRSENVTTQYIEFDTGNGNGHMPAGDPYRDTQFMTMPGERTFERLPVFGTPDNPRHMSADELQAFAARLVETDYNLTVNNWRGHLVYETEYKPLMEWLLKRRMISEKKNDGRGGYEVGGAGRAVFRKLARGEFASL